MSAALGYTAFDNERDNVGVVESVPWADLATQLVDHKVGAKSGPCLACGTFNGTRAKTTVGSRSIIMLDIESTKTGKVPPPPQDVAARLEELDLSATVYSTFSHSDDAPRYRVVLPLDAKFEFPEPCVRKDNAETAAHLTARKIDALVVQAVARMLGLDGVIDRSKLGSESLFFMPRHPEGAAYFAKIVAGKPLSCSELYDAARIAQKFEAVHAVARKDKRGGPIAAYNKSVNLEDLLAEVGYVRRLGSSVDFRSPMQSSASYATRVFPDGRWVSLSASDAAAGLGIPSADNGARCGDAFDIFCFFNHGNDPNAALAAIGGSEDLERMNEKHAVLPIGDKTRVVTFGELPEFLGRVTIVRAQTFGDFKALHDNHRRKYLDQNGHLKSIGLGTWWLNSPHRRQYDGMAFMPRHDEEVVGARLNLWRGFGVKPIKPDGKSGAAGCELFLRFAREVICSDDGDHFTYLIKREATILQERRRSEIAQALQTPEEGAGKGFYELVMRHLLGNHAMQITNPNHIIGRFNPHLEALLRLTADEALFVGDPRHRNALFSLITEPTIIIEPKGLGIYEAQNYLNISILSNSAHFIPVSSTARRFFVPRVSAEHVQDFAYFGAIMDQLVNEHGYEALLYHLLFEVQLRDFDVRQVPRTAALVEQAAYSRRGIDGLVEIVCNEGRVPCEHPKWLGFTITSGQADDKDFYRFIAMQKDQELSRLGGLAVIRRLEKEWGCHAGQRRREPGTHERISGFYWPALADLRCRFEERFGKQQWTNDVVEWSAPGDEEIRARDKGSGEIIKTLAIAGFSGRAVRVAVDGALRQKKWLPLAEIAITYLGDGRAEIVLPGWLAEKKGASAWIDAPAVPEVQALPAITRTVLVRGEAETMIEVGDGRGASAWLPLSEVAVERMPGHQAKIVLPGWLARLTRIEAWVDRPATETTLIDFQKRGLGRLGPPSVKNRT